MICHSLQRTDIIGALCNFFILGLLHNNYSRCVYIFVQSEQIRRQNVWN